MHTTMKAFISTLLALVAHYGTAQRLERLNVDVSSMSVSGFSSGADIGTQFHVAHAEHMIGVGMFAGVPYYCATQNSDICQYEPHLVDIDALQQAARDYASSGQNDDVENMANHRVYVFQGDRDSLVEVEAAYTIRDFYAGFMPQGNVVVDTIVAEHNMPTVNKGNVCTSMAFPWIGRCQFDGAYETVNHILGGDLNRPDRSDDNLPGVFMEFDQSEFLDNQSSMDDRAFIYIPSGCVDSTTACKLHIVFHGCWMGRHAMGTTFAMDSGYNEVGEANNIIMLYPQARPMMPLNPNGCWDWWGYTGNDFATKSARQHQAVARMVDRVACAGMSDNLGAWCDDQ